MVYNADSVDSTTYFFNTDSSEWYLYDYTLLVWNLVPSCVSPEDIFGVIDVALDVGYGPYFPGNPSWFQSLALLDCSGAVDPALAEDPGLAVDGRNRTETVIGNTTGTDNYAGVADGYYGNIRYGPHKAKYGTPPVGTGARYGRAIWQCFGFDVVRIPSACAAGGLNRTAPRLACPVV